MRRYFRVLLFSLISFVLLLIMSSCSGSSSNAEPNPPDEAENVYFLKRTGWQKLRYYYRFDAPVAICDSFARELMKFHNFGNTIEKEKFDTFPVDGDFPKWFDVGTTHDAYLLTGDDRAYAVISVDPETKNGRLYYYFAF